MKSAELRVCASCEWVFHIKNSDEHGCCPKCHFAHYGAHYVYGKKAYRYKITQEPWMEKKLENYRLDLLEEICELKPAVDEGAGFGKPGGPSKCPGKLHPPHF